jgi:hypothetical protein
MLVRSRPGWDRRDPDAQAGPRHAVSRTRPSGLSTSSGAAPSVRQSATAAAFPPSLASPVPPNHAGPGEIQDLPHRGGRGRMAEPDEFALHPQVPPHWIIHRHADHELADRGCRGRPTGTTTAGVVPFAATSRRCQASSVDGVTVNTSPHWQRGTNRASHLPCTRWITTAISSQPAHRGRPNARLPGGQTASKTPPLVIPSTLPASVGESITRDTG